MKTELTRGALIITDIQNDFLPGGALAIADGDAIIPVVNRLQPSFSTIVATQDWHPANHQSFAANHPGKKVFEQIQLNGLPQTLWPVHCVQNTRGAEFAGDLKKGRIEKVFQKGVDPEIDSYSGFFDNGHRRATGLGAWLKGKGITDIYICGLATDYCVKFSALDAIGVGFKVHLFTDACRGVNLNADDVPTAMQEMRRAGVMLKEATQF